MLKKLNFFKKFSKERDFDSIIKDTHSTCENLLSNDLSNLGIENYEYTTDEAVEELGLDEDLVHQLVEDYVTQVIKSITQFEEYLSKLVESEDTNNILDYTPFRELAHKNLGVARNLRIRDAEKILYELMKKDDLEYLLICIEALRVCTIRLKPECAFHTLKLIEVKSSL
jgi:hypothetical protein